MENSLVVNMFAMNSIRNYKNLQYTGNNDVEALKQLLGSLSINEETGVHLVVNYDWLDPFLSN